MRLTLLVAGFAALVAVPGLPVEQVAQVLDGPIIVRGPVPFATHEGFGAARVRLMAADGRTISNVIETAPVEFRIETLLQAFTQWRISQPIPVTTLAVSFRLQSGKSCDRDTNQLVEIDWPTIRIQASDFWINFRECYPDEGVRREYAASLPLSGVVVDDAGLPLSGVQVNVSDSGARLLPRGRQLATDLDGRFVASGLPPGEYSVSFRREGFTGPEFLVRATADIPPTPWRVTMSGIRWSTPLPPARVTAADLPVFPTDAWMAGVSGTVDVRLSFAESARERNRHWVSDIDAVGTDERLVRAARENAATWRFEDVTVPVLTVQYHFRLEPGTCTAAHVPSMRLRFPTTVEITARRRIPCGSTVPGVLRRQVFLPALLSRGLSAAETETDSAAGRARTVCQAPPPFCRAAP